MFSVDILFMHRGQIFAVAPTMRPQCGHGISFLIACSSFWPFGISDFRKQNANATPQRNAGVMAIGPRIPPPSSTIKPAQEAPATGSSARCPAIQPPIAAANSEAGIAKTKFIYVTTNADS